MLSPTTRNDPYRIYVPNSGGASVDVIDPHTMQIVAHYPTGTSPQHVVPAWDLKPCTSPTILRTPDMGGLSPDGKVFWLAGRYSSAVYAISTRDGHLIARISVGMQPHGLCVWPQPGRYSLGHTGVTR